MSEVWLVVVERKQCYQCHASEHVVGAYSTKELAEEAAQAIAHDEEQDDVAFRGRGGRVTRDGMRFIDSANLDTLVAVRWTSFDRQPGMEWKIGERAKPFEGRDS